MFSWIGLFGQIKVSQQVFASGGSASLNESGTLGESVIFGGKDNMILCQGFQTGFYYTLTDVVETDSDNLQWELYPIPTATGIHVRCNVDKPLKIELRSTSGSLLKTWNILSNEENNYFDLSDFTSGQYILTALDERNSVLKSARLIIYK